MTTAYNNTLDEDKGFQKVIEGFNNTSEQIRSLQKALANHRHDFNYRLSHLEDLLLLRDAITARSAQHTNRHARHELETMGVHGTNCCSSYDKKPRSCTYTGGILNVR